ncbi:MAG: 16S rRNA processing protein RimM [SAR202 cluster bacterium]|nr:16S rRNA processing protein RimM [SAR202 cluster bacterium]
MVAVGVVRRPWGFDGSVVIAQNGDDPDRLAAGRTVHIGTERYLIERAGASGASLVVKLSSIDTEDQANALRGKALEVPAGDIPPPPRGSYYHYEILGARVITRSGEELGRVVEILQTGSNDVYVVRSDGPDKAEILIPALREILLDIDTNEGRITVDLPEGLR